MHTIITHIHIVVIGVDMDTIKNMKRNISLFVIALGVLAIISYVGVTHGASTYTTIEALINRLVDASSDDASLRVEFANSVSAFTATSLSVSGTSTLTGAVTAADDVSVAGWSIMAPTIVTAQDYTLSSTGKAAYYIWNRSDTGGGNIFLQTGATNGTFVCVADGDLNAGSNNLTINTEGSETINEAATYVLNANGESICTVYNSAATDWAIMSGYAE